MDTIRLPQAFSDILRLLNENEARYLVIGGFAVAYHGFPRVTGDIDIWVDPQGTNPAKVHTAVVAFGFDLETLRPEDFGYGDRVVRLGYPPMRVEFMTAIPGVEFDTCYKKRVEADFGGLTASMIGLACLRANKASAGRLKDLHDLQNLPEA